MKYSRIWLILALLTLGLVVAACGAEPETITVVETVVVEKEVEVETVVEKEVEVVVTVEVEVEAEAAVVEPRGTFRNALSVPPTGFQWSPWKSAPPAVLAWYEVPYEGLITENADGEIVGVLAESWSYNDDLTELTFNLKEGVLFHDGTPFNAEAVKSNIEYIKNENGFPPNVGALRAVEEVVAEDELTAVFKLSQPDIALVANLARFVGLMVSPNAYDSIGAAPVGTGPYKMVPEENTPDQVWVFEPFEDYYDPSVIAFERVELHWIQDPNARANALLNGDMEAINVEGGDLPALEGTAGFNISRAPMVGVGLQVLDLNGEMVPELANKDVRCAISQSIDREAINAVIMSGNSYPGVQREVKGQYGYLDDPPDVGYNPDAARAKLEAAGVESLDLFSGFWGGPFAAVGQGAAGGMAEVGINIEFEQFPPPDMWANAFAGTYAIQPLPWPEPHLITAIRNRAVAGPANPSGYVPEGVAELLAEAEGLPADEAEPLLEEIKAIMIEECIWIHVTTIEGIVMYTDQITGIEKVPAQPLTFDIKTVRWADQ